MEERNDMRILMGLAAVSAAFAMAPTAASAQSCTGNCGVLGPDGVVTAPPAYGPAYRYVSTWSGVAGAGQLPGVGGTNGSLYETASFAATAGQELVFYFNFVTADGTSSFPDYAWSSLVNGSSELVLFTARTTTSGDTVPGFGLPGLAPGVVLTPATTPIIPTPPVWSALGDSSGFCFGGPGQGCGYTGWIKSTYTITADGTYSLRFGASNFGDFVVDTGLAFTGIVLDGDIVDPPVPIVPEPGTWAMMIAGFGLVGFAARRRRVALTA
jgi:hypothetical protein